MRSFVFLNKQKRPGPAPEVSKILENNEGKDNVRQSAFVFEESYMTASGYLLIDETFHGSF